jgi:hypothetical protein
MTLFSPPSGLATGSFNGLHTKSKFLASNWDDTVETLEVLAAAVRERRAR